MQKTDMRVHASNTINSVSVIGVYLAIGVNART